MGRPDRALGVIENGVVAVEGGRILQIGTAAQVLTAHPPDRIEVLSDHVLLPGLVNAHTHAAMTLLRGYGVDLAADDLAPGTHMADGALLGGPGVRGRRARGSLVPKCSPVGVTCFTDTYFFPEAAIEVARRSGIRIMSGQVVVDGPTNYASDASEHLAKALAVIEQ